MNLNTNSGEHQKSKDQTVVEPKLTVVVRVEDGKDIGGNRANQWSEEMMIKGKGRINLGKLFQQ